MTNDSEHDRRNDACLNRQTIARLNDELRRTLTGGIVLLTQGVAASEDSEAVVQAVKRYEFQGIDGNNPYGENDFGAIAVNGTKYFFKIDYYDRELTYHSPDPANPRVTKRVLTIMRADEY